MRPIGLSARCLQQKPTSALLVLRSNFSTTSRRLAESSQTERLSWQEYLAVRGSKRRWQNAAMVPCALLGFFGGAAYFGNLETDPLKPIMGIDPFFFYGICTVGCVGLGAIVGPSIGSAIWRMKNSNRLVSVDAMDKEFYKRIARNRVDASLQSPTQPVPDYYGEKIGSLHQYRRWLRDQGKYKRKALLPEE